MQILSDKPQLLESILDDGIHVHHSPPLDIYSKANSLMKTLKGLYVSSKLDLENETLLSYIRECAKPAVDVEPVCVVCSNYQEFDDFLNQYIDDEDELRVAYDVETTAAPFLSPKYRLAGFSLANTVKVGCYVILKSIDVENPDIDLCLNRLKEVIESHKMLVFNSQHEYIATRVCVGTDILNNSKHLDDAYAMALVLKTESFKADVFKLKLLCHRLLGTDNWASIIDDYIDLAMKIAQEDNFSTDGTNAKQYSMYENFCDILEEYNYTKDDCDAFIAKIRDSYEDWKNQNTIPYTLIPSRMVAKYGCYDSCYLIALFDFMVEWAEELEEKLQGAICSPHVMESYESCVRSQVMSGVLTMNGIFISEERDEEVRQKAAVEAEKYYDKLWEVKSDVTGESIVREFIIHDEKQRLELEKKYLLPKQLLNLIPDGFEFISTTPTFYSFTVRKKTVDLDDWIAQEGLKPVKASEPDVYKILQKHLKPFSVLDDEDKLLNEVLDEYIEGMTKKHGSRAAFVFKPMSSPDALLDIITRELIHAKFMSRVILYEYHNLPDKYKDALTDKFFEENSLFNFDSDTESFNVVAKRIKKTVLDYLSKQYSYKDMYENLVKDGIHSFSSPIISYIYNVFTATGCTFNEPKHAAFDFICRLKTCRKYQRIISTFIAGSSGGYACQSYVYNDSIDKDHLVIAQEKVCDDKKNLIPGPSDTSRVVFGSWYANTAETGRWQATVHNVPAGPFCKRRFVSRFKGGVILANDMSQMEVRELAAISKCQKLLDIIKDPSVDIHKRTASLAFDVPYDKVTSTQRKQTKTGIFSVVYGREEQSLAQELFNGDNAAAKRLMDSIFKVYPEISIYLSGVLADAKKFGYIVTRQGCPIFVNPQVQAGDNKSEAAFSRNTRNYGIQGGSSTGACTGTLVNIQRLLDKNNLKSKIVCYIHDSIEVDCHPDEFDSVLQIMSYAFNELATKQFNVPTASDSTVGVSLGEELDIKRLEKNHYLMEGNSFDIQDMLNQLSLTYDINVIKDELGEIKHMEDDIAWVFTPRSELKWYDQKQNREVEFKISKK